MSYKPSGIFFTDEKGQESCLSLSDETCAGWIFHPTDHGQWIGDTVATDLTAAVAEYVAKLKADIEEIANENLNDTLRILKGTD